MRPPIPRSTPDTHEERLDFLGASAKSTLEQAHGQSVHAFDHAMQLEAPALLQSRVLRPWTDRQLVDVLFDVDEAGVFHPLF